MSCYIHYVEGAGVGHISDGWESADQTLALTGLDKGIGYPANMGAIFGYASELNL